MPTVKEFKKNKKRVSPHHMEEPSARPGRAKRRPGREEVDASENGHDVEDEADTEIEMKPKRAKAKSAKKAVEHEEQTEFEETEVEVDEASVEEEAEASEPVDRIEIQFKGSEVLRAKFPKTFDLAEEVATQWMHDGSFEGLPIDHPLGQWAAQTGLVKAKEIEKKVVESPLFEKAAIGVLTYGMKAQGLIQKLKERLQNR